MKTFLVPLLGIPEDRGTLLNAIEVARIAGGHVTALLPEHGIEVARKVFEEVARERALAETQAPVSPGHVEVTLESLEVQAPGGTMEATMRGSAIYQDALLLAHSINDTNEPLQRNALEWALNAGRPVIVLPASLPQPFGSRIGIAWNASLQAAHAVTAALPWLHRAASVHVLTAATSEIQASCADDLRRYLAWHHVDATTRTCDPGSGFVGTAILKMARDVNADMLVAGAYSHARMREVLLGGVTRQILSEARVPVLFSR